ncbi:exodeoxyribonuclease V subunit alpha [Pasteurellaceae bacterium 22721_9_1]
MLKLLEELCQQQRISRADYYFAKFIAEKQKGFDYPKETQDLAILLAALCQYSLSQGNTCLFLDKDLQRNYFGLGFAKLDVDYMAEIEQKIGHLPMSEWANSLQDHIAFSCAPLDKIAPLVFQHNALYFYRSWQDEYRLADFIKSAVKKEQVFFNEEQVKTILQRYFAPVSEQTNWQKIAVAIALRQSFCLISGGPGTGKTYTVARLLLALQELHNGQLKIGLAAPTGKAATRLDESIAKEFASQALKKAISELKHNLTITQAQTLHKMLGVRPFSEQPLYNANHPLPYDVLIVDEASMIDLSMMDKLRAALSANCKLILLGDKDQLASVEAGAILGELGQFMGMYYDEQRQKMIGCYGYEFTEYLTSVTDENLQSSSQPLHPLANCLCYLPDSRRFSQDSGIGQLATAINRKDKQAGELSWSILQQQFNKGRVDIECYPSQETESANYVQHCVSQITQSAVQKYQDYLLFLTENPNRTDEAFLQQLFKKFNSIRFLTALREGHFGVEQLNKQIAEQLKNAGLVSFQYERDWYIGKPIMITRNDHNTGLSNGDIGLYIGKNQLCFDTSKGYRLISRSRIPTQYETAFAMTVHKSQGSEFEHTILVLPPEMNPVLSKELVYTAVTRAKEQFTVFCTEAVWKSAVQKNTKRQSGLRFVIDQ